MKILIWFFSTKTGIALLIGLLIIIGAGLAQFYYFEKPVIAKKEAMKTGGVMLQKIAENVEKASKDGQKWPERTDWFPKNLPCAAHVKVKLAEPWGKLGFEDGQKTDFQYRLDTNGDQYFLRARRDTDCDGVFATHTIEGTTDWTSTFRRSATMKNIKE